jgi:FMN phosphatase YigB (HAD superfamily)
MQTNQMQRFFFDFDGVICDSSFEAFRILLYSSNLIDTPLSNAHDEKYEKFLELRSKVGPAWNYYYVSKELLSTDTISWVLNAPALKYQNLFFKNRSEFIKTNYAQWIKLHTIYENIEIILKKIDNIIILTNKPSNPVIHILEHFGLFNYVSKIISLPETKYQSKLDFFQNCGDVSGIFIDDHLETALTCHKFLHPKILSLHANWGYHKGSISDKSISMKELMRYCSDEL